MSSEYPEIVFTFENNRRNTQPAVFEIKSQSTSESLLKPKHFEIDSLDWDKIFSNPLNLKSPGRSPARSPSFSKFPVIAKSQGSAKSPISPRPTNSPGCFRVNRSSKTLITKPASKPENPKKIIHSKSDHLSIAEEETGEEELLKIKQNLASTKASLSEIRTNAKKCLEFSKNLVVNSKKKQKNRSLFTETQAVSMSFNLEAQKNILRQMTLNISLLNDRVSNHEEKNEHVRGFETSIKSQIADLFEKIEKKKNKKESNKHFLSTCQLF
jgi:DNA-binding transcriptional regulator GbsR (MarR family)